MTERRTEVVPGAVYRAAPGSDLDDTVATEVGPLLHGLALTIPPDRVCGMVVKAARPEHSPLHGWFEWDDSIAGEKYRRLQAGKLLQSVVVEVQAKPAATLDGIQVIAVEAVPQRTPWREARIAGVPQGQPLDPVARAHQELLAWRARWGAVANPAFERFRPIIAAIDALNRGRAQRRCLECREPLAEDWPKVRCEHCAIRPAS